MEAQQRREKRRQWQVGGSDTEDTEDVEEEEEPENDDHLDGQNARYGIEGAVVVNSLSYQEFRNRLVEHFDILHRKHQVRWPQRRKNK